MKPLEQRSKQLLEYLWRGGQWGYFWTLDRASSVKRTHWTPTDSLGMAPNGKADVYFGVNPTATQKDKFHRALIQDITAVNCLFAEFDGKDFNGKDSALNHVRSLRPLPSVVIDSGGGYHCYWLLKDTFIIENDQEREYIRGTLARWVDFVQGDTVKDLARVLRVPGTHNYKPTYGPEPPSVEFVFSDFDKVYGLAGLTQLLPPPEEREEKKRTSTKPANLDDGELLQKIRDSKQGPKFTDLYDRGSWENYYKSQSEADAGLCIVLLGWAGGDVSRTDRLFRQSALFREDKWDSNRHGGTYGSITLDFALSKASWFYEQRATITAKPPEERPWEEMEAPPQNEDFFQIPEQPPEDEEPAGWRWLTMSDAYAERAPREYIIEKLLPRQSLTMPYGSPGGLKTMLVMDMAMSVLAGEPFLQAMPGIERASPFETQKTAVMWIDVDNGERRSLDRMKAMGKAHNLPDDAPFYFVSFPTPPFIASNDESVDFIIDSVLMGEVGLVVFDNLGTISGGADENSNQMVGVMSGLRRVAERGNCAVVVIHHRNKGNGLVTRKGNALRGHSSIEGALDLAFLIEREEGEDVITIQSTKTRDIPVWPFEAMWTYKQDEAGELTSGRFWGLGRPEKDDADRPAKDRAYEAILIDLGPGDVLAQSAIVTKLKPVKIGRNATLTALAQMEREKLVGVSRGDRNAKLYKLTRLGIEKQREILYNR